MVLFSVNVTSAEVILTPSQTLLITQRYFVLSKSAWQFEILYVDDVAPLIFSHSLFEFNFCHWYLTSPASLLAETLNETISPMLNVESKN